MILYGHAWLAPSAHSVAKHQARQPIRWRRTRSLSVSRSMRPGLAVVDGRDRLLRGDLWLQVPASQSRRL